MSHSALVPIESGNRAPVYAIITPHQGPAQGYAWDSGQHRRRGGAGRSGPVRNAPQDVGRAPTCPNIHAPRRRRPHGFREARDGALPRLRGEISDHPDGTAGRHPAVDLSYRRRTAPMESAATSRICGGVPEHRQRRPEPSGDPHRHGRFVLRSQGIAHLHSQRHRRPMGRHHGGGAGSADEPAPHRGAP